MKIIDILNLLANEEYDKLPKKIKVEDNIFIFEYNESCNTYCNKYDSSLGILFRIDEILNNNVEIIEEPENDYIKELDIRMSDDDSECLSDDRGVYCGMNKHSRTIAHKLNEVIRKINEMGKSD